MNKLTSFIHSLFCPLNHLQRMEEIKAKKDDPDVCLFYLEAVYDDCWTCRDHLLWTEKTKRLLQELETNTPEEAFFLLNQALRVVQTANPLLQKHPAMKRVIISLLEVA